MSFISEMILFIDETNARPFGGVFDLCQYMMNKCSVYCLYLYGIVLSFIKEQWNIPDKVDCEKFTLSTTVKHIRPLLSTIAKAPKFLNWLNGIHESNVRVENIEVMDADFFGPTNPDRLGFLKIKCTAYGPNNLPVDGIVLIRGHCAVVCTIITNLDNGNEYVLTTEQFRMPMKERIEEFLAGMCDQYETEDSYGKPRPVLNAILVKELKDEAGLVLDPNDSNLHYMGDIKLSPGLLDEKAKMFVWFTSMLNSDIEEMLKKEHGETGTNERIKIHLYLKTEFQKELERIGDAKTEVAFIRATNYCSPYEQTQMRNVTLRKRPIKVSYGEIQELMRNGGVPARTYQDCVYEDEISR